MTLMVWRYWGGIDLDEDDNRPTLRIMILFRDERRGAPAANWRGFEMAYREGDEITLQTVQDALNAEENLVIDGRR